MAARAVSATQAMAFLVMDFRAMAFPATVRVLVGVKCPRMPGPAAAGRKAVVVKIVRLKTYRGAAMAKTAAANGAAIATAEAKFTTIKTARTTRNGVVDSVSGSPIAEGLYSSCAR